MTQARRVTVLGASGFIGRATARAFADTGWVVHAAARRIHAVPDHDAITPILLTTDPSNIADVIAGSNPAVIVNLAAPGVTATANPAEFSAGTKIVDSIFDGLDAGHRTTVIHTGSWSQYDPALLGPNPVNEDTAQRPTSPYGIAKAEAESRGFERCSDQHRFVSLRLFNVYGPGEAQNRLVPYLVSALDGDKEACLTEGSQVRDFVYVSDVVAAMSAVAAHDVESDAFNVASGTGTAVATIATMVADALGTPHSRLAFGAKNDREPEPAFAVGNPSKIEAAFGWTAKVPVATGVNSMIRALTRGSHG